MIKIILFSFNLQLLIIIKQGFKTDLEAINMRTNLHILIIFIALLLILQEYQQMYLLEIITII